MTTNLFNDPLLATHVIVVILFILIYLVKTLLLLSNKAEALARFTKITKVPEMIISLTFLVTGVWMLVKLPSINTLLIVKIIVVLLSIPIAVIGFKKKSKVMGLLALLMIIGAYGLAEVSTKKRIQGNEIVTDKNTATKADIGKSVYDAKCANCHGPQGNAGIGGAKDLSATAMSDDEIKHIIRNGKGMMPPADLTDEQVDAVTEYVKILKK